MGRQLRSIGPASWVSVATTLLWLRSCCGAQKLQPQLANLFRNAALNCAEVGSHDVDEDVATRMYLSKGRRSRCVLLCVRVFVLTHKSTSAADDDLSKTHRKRRRRRKSQQMILVRCCSDSVWFGLVWSGSSDGSAAAVANGPTRLGAHSNRIGPNQPGARGAAERGRAQRADCSEGSRWLADWPGDMTANMIRGLVASGYCGPASVSSCWPRCCCSFGRLTRLRTRNHPMIDHTNWPPEKQTRPRSLFLLAPELQGTALSSSARCLLSRRLIIQEKLEATER